MQYTISLFRPGQEAAIYQLIRNCFDVFVAPEYSEEGNRFFYDWIAPEQF